MSFKGLLKRIGVSLITLFSSMVLTFFLLRLTPGNIFDKMARDYAAKNGVTVEQATEIVTKMSNYNPHENFFLQFYKYISGMLHGNFGTSMYNSGLTVVNILQKALPWTVFILTIALSVSFIIGVNLGIIMAWKRKSILNPIISVYSIISTSIPNFLVAILLVIVFSFKLKWFPMRGAYDADVATPGFNIRFILNILHHAGLPILTYVLTSVGTWSLTMMGSSIAVLGEDYINSAWIRGIPEKRIMKYYVKKNAMLPLIPTIALSFGTMIGGATLIEGTFNYPGMGLYMGQAASRRDFTIQLGLIVVTSMTVILANFIADLIYAKFDPRVKMED